MSKVIFVLELPEPKLRKTHAPPSKRHKDATKYSRKQKHKAKREEAPVLFGSFFQTLDKPPYFFKRGFVLCKKLRGSGKA